MKLLIENVKIIRPNEVLKGHVLEIENGLISGISKKDKVFNECDRKGQPLMTLYPKDSIIEEYQDVIKSIILKIYPETKEQETTSKSQIKTKSFFMRLFSK